MPDSNVNMKDCYYMYNYQYERLLLSFDPGTHKVQQKHSVFFFFFYLELFCPDSSAEEPVWVYLNIS